jgi:dethiobiotin synthetase/adenosylmethionine--8-amino-7-oxononanoate aminotransferase
LDSVEVQEQVQRLDMYLKQQWDEHVDILWELREEGSKQLWWPFTQHRRYDDKKVQATVIDGAKGDYFSILENKIVAENRSENQGGKDVKEMVRTAHFDACASWWTQGIGHGETTLSLAAAAAAGKYGHVIFPDVVHEPARALANRLLNSKSGPGRGWASRVFFTDDGSTAMEVAIKMGMKKFIHDMQLPSKRGGEAGLKRKQELLLEEGVKLTVCAQQDCYHGDTLGVMDVAEPSVFNKGQHPWYEPKGLFLQYPIVRYVNGSIGITPPSCCPASPNSSRFDNVEDIFNIQKRLSSDDLYTHYCNVIEKEWDAYESESNR